MNNNKLNNSSENFEETKISELYTGARGIAIKILNRVDRTDAYLDKLIDMELKHGELSSQDKALLNELVHGVTRWMNRLDWILGSFYFGQFSKAIPILKNTLRVALYQILFLDKIPHHAAVNEAVEFIKKIQGKRSADLVNAVLRNIIRALDVIRYPDKNEDTLNYLSIYYSHPLWLVKKWLSRYGQEFTEKLMLENNERPKLTLRYNQTLTDKESFIKNLNEAGLKYREAKYLPHYIILINLTNIAEWSYFKSGYFSIQDESAGIPCVMIDPKPNEEIIDLCSAPGGKTTYLAELLMNKGKIYAVDKYKSRIDILKRNVDRLKLTNVEFIEGDSETLEFKLVDKILIDAPCTGLGVLTKKPDIKWKRDSEDIKKLNNIQKKLLDNASKYVKVGGAIVYSTCTIEPEENFEIVKDFLINHPNFELITQHPSLPQELIDENGCVSTYPHIHSMDGSFSAKLIRKS